MTFQTDEMERLRRSDQREDWRRGVKPRWPDERPAPERSGVVLDSQRLARVTLRVAYRSTQTVNRQKEKWKSLQSRKNAFKGIALEWLEKHNCTPDHKKRTLRRFETDIFPWLGDRAIKAIESPV